MPNSSFHAFCLHLLKASNTKAGCIAGAFGSILAFLLLGGFIDMTRNLVLHFDDSARQFSHTVEELEMNCDNKKADAQCPSFTDRLGRATDYFIQKSRSTSF